MMITDLMSVQERKELAWVASSKRPSDIRFLAEMLLKVIAALEREEDYEREQREY